MPDTMPTDDDDGRVGTSVSAERAGDCGEVPPFRDIKITRKRGEGINSPHPHPAGRGSIVAQNI